MAFKELYLSVFVLFFRIGAGQWPSYMNADAHKGVAGVTIIEVLLVASLINWIQIIGGHRLELNRWMPGIAAVVLYCANYYFFVVRGSGIAYEREFSGFRKGKRIALRLAVIVILLVTLAVFFSSAAYHRI
jgi:hypothetical protein